jgi:hypothetical protein
VAASVAGGQRPHTSCSLFLYHHGNITDLTGGNENRLQESTAMPLFVRILHVLAVGLWFGAAVFLCFVVAPSVYNSLVSLAEKAERPVWFRAVSLGQGRQGTLAADHAVGLLLDHYFLLQGFCGFVAAVTALGWWRADPGRLVHKVRVIVVLFALAAAVAGWPIARHVRELQVARDKASEAVTQGSAAIGNLAAWRKQFSAIQTQEDQLRSKEKEAKLRAEHQNDLNVLGTALRELDRWHPYGLMLKFLTVILVTVTMGLTVCLPKRTPAPGAS